MKTKKPRQYGKNQPEEARGILRETGPAYTTEEDVMVRTQIYLSRGEHEFVQREAGRLNQPMAAVIRRFIDEKMEAPENAWTNNPMLAPSAEDPSWVGHEDGAINHDHYVYGSPKKFVKRKGQWTEAPPLPDDYFDNPSARAAYDSKLEKAK